MRYVVASLLVLSFLIFIMSSGCSVVMASKTKGTSIETLRECRTRTCVLSKDGVEKLSRKDLEKGEFIEEYRVLKRTGSASRAVMHGVLDVFTLGLWEIAGTPIEGAAGKKTYLGIRIFYDKDNSIKNVEIAP